VYSYSEDSEPRGNRVKPEESLAEAHSGCSGQIERRICVEGMFTMYFTLSHSIISLISSLRVIEVGIDKSMYEPQLGLGFRGIAACISASSLSRGTARLWRGQRMSK